MNEIEEKVALITGITGQDGAYLAEFLLDKGYIVNGLKRRTSLFNTDRIDHLYKDPHEPDTRFFLHHGDMTDSSSLIRIIQQTQPDEIYNLAGRGPAAGRAHPFRYRDDAGAGLLLGDRELLTLPVRTQSRRASADLYRLPAGGGVAGGGRVARDHPAAGRHV